jgi:hypothetical protein
VVSHLLDHASRRRYELAAAELASRYDWSVIGESFAQVLCSMSRTNSPVDAGRALAVQA